MDPRARPPFPTKRSRLLSDPPGAILEHDEGVAAVQDVLKDRSRRPHVRYL